MTALVCALAIGGAIVYVAGLLVPGVPAWVAAAGLAAWLLALVLLVAEAVRRARRQRRSFLSTLGSVTWETVKYVFWFAP